jgi:hypothetical protein
MATTDFVPFRTFAERLWGRASIAHEAGIDLCKEADEIQLIGRRLSQVDEKLKESVCPARRQVAACGVVGFGPGNAMYFPWFY